MNMRGFNYFRGEQQVRDRKQSAALRDPKISSPQKDRWRKAVGKRSKAQ